MITLILQGFTWLFWHFTRYISFKLASIVDLTAGYLLGIAYSQIRFILPSERLPVSCLPVKMKKKIIIIICKFTVFSFYTLSVRVQNVLAKSNVLSEIQRSMLESGLRIEDLPSEPTRLPVERINTESISTQRTVGGSAGLCHFMYKSVYLNQFVSSDFSAPLKNPNQQKR